ncbi:DUF499 domain-containing protein [Candidatus Igneacidithiobacillus taiwanensis]|uniref:ATP-binding protein n=1 Tax=Candidatus Igneacidithiobacillus taiwanensis TaxID=1945924 RepID=UPI0028967DB5|nr:DUF499 domain-containing protein [Candidatus Igneacidithiobacillus taiwanensis]
MNLRPWREIAVPHEDVLRGTFQQAEFAADLSRVHAGTAAPHYQDPALFFQRTFTTEGMRLLLDSVVRRLAGKGGDPVIQLQTAFGGGKTHTLLAVYHLAKGLAPVSELPGVAPILDAAGISELPRARIAVLDGVKSSPNQPVAHDGVLVHTLWGDLAWQLGGAEGYDLVAEADRSGTSPGKAVLETLIARYAPCVILMDELVAYVRQFEEGKSLSGGTFDSNLSFVQALTEALKGVPTAVLLASLPESDKEAGTQRGVRALEALAHYFGRVQALWKPVATEEAFEIVRRRLFTPIADGAALDAACRAFVDFYDDHRDDFPQEVQESRYLERMRRAYPIHPEIFDRLYEDWSSLEGFQRTRGVLKIMAKVIHRLWKDGNNDLLILPGGLPLYDPDVRNELLYYLPAGWDPVIERDVDGERAETTEIESLDTRFGSVQACRRCARSIFLGSAPSTANQSVRGLELERVLLGAMQPGQQTGLFRDALRRLGERLHYLNQGNHRFWLDTRPNLRREMEERKRRLSDREDVLPTLRGQLQSALGRNLFPSVHIFVDSSDVPDDWALHLVVLPPDAAHHRNGQGNATTRALEILKKRGEQPRFKQNRLIFLAADQDTVLRLKDHVRSFLAWRSIVEDYQHNRIVLDNLTGQQAIDSSRQGEEVLRRALRESYRWILAPVQQAQPGKPLSEIQWEAFATNPGNTRWSEEIERVLEENELVIRKWAPIHLRTILRNWFWKPDHPAANAASVWQQCCQQLYLPRLADDRVFFQAIAAGAGDPEFFAIAQGQEDGRYVGLVLGKPTVPIFDTALLLVEPAAAAEYQRAHMPTALTTGDGVYMAPEPGAQPTPGVEEGSHPQSYPTTPSETAAKSRKTRFHGSMEIDPLRAKQQFLDLVDEVLQHFTLDPNIHLSISVEIQARSSNGLSESLQRIVRENSRVLRFKHAEFEEE